MRQIKLATRQLLGTR